MVARQAGNEVIYLFVGHPSATLRASLGSASLVAGWQGNQVSEVRYTLWE